MGAVALGEFSPSFFFFHFSSSWWGHFPLSTVVSMHPKPVAVFESHDASLTSMAMVVLLGRWERV